MEDLGRLYKLFSGDVLFPRLYGGWRTRGSLLGHAKGLRAVELLALENQFVNSSRVKDRRR